MKLQLQTGTNPSDKCAIFTVTLVIFTRLSTAEDCYYKPCQKYGTRNKVCQFTIGCRLERSFANCNVSSMHLNKPTFASTQSKCIDPGLVPGFKDFCQDLLYKGNTSAPGPAIINNDDVTNFPKGGVISENKIAVDSYCYGTTVLASVATGCFLAGGFIVWLLIFCCRLSIYPCARNKDDSVIVVGNDHSNLNPAVRGREMGSTSSAQLLTNASVESMSTHNTLLSNSDGQPTNEKTTNRPPPALHSSATWEQSGLRPQFGHSRSPSAPWVETSRPLLPNSRSRSAQWINSGGTSLTRSLARATEWNNTDQMALPRPQAESMPWIGQGQSLFANVQSQSAPWLDTIYSPESESSSRDYQSIHGGSENPYAPCSESSSDYSAPQTHRVMIIHDGEIYQASSESSGSNNDYTSLKGQRFVRTNDGIYYPTSEGSSKDYASLASERDDFVTSVGIVDKVNCLQRDREDSGNNMKFSVKGLAFPYQASLKSNRGWTSNLQEINEYETVDSRKAVEEDVDVGNVRTLADLCDVNHNTEATAQPHEYFTLEPVQNKGK